MTALADIALCTGIPVAKIMAAVRSGRCGQDAAGQITDLYGLSLAPSLHRIEIESRIVFSCCALWAHVIPQLVERASRIESVDPVGRGIVRLTISPDGVEAVDPPGAVATLVHATREEVATDVGAGFCSHVRHFVSKVNDLKVGNGNSKRAERWSPPHH